jgi:two-component system response regulator VicR
MARILIIDDERGVCEEFSQLLREEKHEVDTAPNAKEGIGKALKNNYDLIFLDVLMPKVEGREALAEIKKSCQTPVVIMSGYLPPGKEGDILNAGAFACIRKPLDLKEVFALIDKALETK